MISPWTHPLPHPRITWSRPFPSFAMAASLPVEAGKAVLPMPNLFECCPGSGPGAGSALRSKGRMPEERESSRTLPAEWKIHATAVVIGEAGVLIRGTSGAGKSALALALMASGSPLRSVWLVADDRVCLSVVHGRLIARPHPAIAGLIEQRGEGLIPSSFESAAVVRCAVDLCPLRRRRDIPPRSPGDDDRSVTLGGVALPRLALPQEISPEEASRRIISFLGRL